MQTFINIVALTAPLFLLVLAGYCLTRVARWPKDVSDALTRFVFSIGVPALLFRMMSDFSRLPAVDARLLIAFFGGCLAVYIFGRALGRWLFKMDGVSRSIFGLGGIFSNNVLLGVPLATATLGDRALPAVSLILVFNALLLWTLVTVSVEWARSGSLSMAGLWKTCKGVITNPVVASILGGTVFGFVGLPVPTVVDRTLELVGQSAVPLSLIALGMGLAEFGISESWRESMTVCILKLVAHPFAVYVLAVALGLPALETQVVVVMAALPVGANVYLMSRQFGRLEGTIASSLVFSTALAAVSTTIILALVATIP